MPTADNFLSSALIKMLLLGDSGAGKTSSLVSLLKAGYKIKLADMDKNMLNLVLHAKKDCPDKLSNLEYETYTDEYRATAAGLILKGQPKAFTNLLGKLSEWSGIEDANTVVVVDSLSAVGRAAFEWAKGMNPMSKDPRQWYGAAQKGIEDMIALLTSDQFKTNVIIITHVKYAESELGSQKGYANSLGQALNTVVPRYFSTMIQAEVTGTGNNLKRELRTLPTGIVDLKIPPLGVPAKLPLETGLADIFSALKM